MVEYTTVILKFDQQGEKTGWTYIEVPRDVAEQLKPGYKKSFRVRGRLDEHPVEKVALLPMGNGDFILPFNADIRRGTGKRQGAMLHVQLEEDARGLEINSQLMECLADEPEALAFFNSLTGSHQRYFSKWIESAKTEATFAKRIAQTVNAMSRRQSYSEMIRALKAHR
jgi:hypothetical protein